MSPRHYLQGVPCWIDTEQPDPKRARHFYTRLLQWTTDLATASDDPSRYFTAALDGLTAGGIGSATGSQARWNTYVAVDDVHAAVRRVTDGGGTVEVQPFDVGGQGRAARCVDPAGARFGLWQAGDTAGVEVAKVPGAWDVSELHCDDHDAAGTFYGAVFGWQLDTVDIGTGEWASMFRAPGDGRRTADDPEDRDGRGHAPQETSDAIGWLAPLEPEADGPYWQVTFTVGDRDAAVAIAQRLGAEIVSQLDSRWTRSARVLDPQGALLTLSQALSGR